VTTSRAAGPLLAGSVCLVLGGCASAPPHASANVSAGAKDIATWALPLDPYLQPAWNPVSYATDILTKRCMDRTQYAWPLAPQTIDPPVGESWNKIGRKLFTPGLAARYGYSNSDQLVVSAAENEARRREFETPFDPAGSDDLDRCTAEARKHLEATRNPYELAQRVQFAKESAADARKVRAAARRWKDCMRPLGIPDVPDSPNDMGESIFLPKSDRGPLDSPTSAPITTREKEVATHDATCQQSSGYAQASYTAEWNAEVGALRENADALERDRREADAQRKRALAIIAEYALPAAQ
jgi:hypothetical protein